MSDYRYTSHEKKTGNYLQAKTNLAKRINNESRYTDMHAAVSDSRFKNIFHAIYDNKCVYCGVTKRIAGRRAFEADHFFPFCAKDLYSGDINELSNLVASCSDCNGSKTGKYFKDDTMALLHPDKKLDEVFKREENYQIVISDEYRLNDDVKFFYDLLHLRSYHKRLDFLLMDLIGFVESEPKKIDDATMIKLHRIIEELLSIRNSLY